MRLSGKSLTCPRCGTLMWDVVSERAACQRRHKKPRRFGRMKSGRWLGRLYISAPVGRGSGQDYPSSR